MGPERKIHDWMVNREAGSCYFKDSPHESDAMRGYCHAKLSAKQAIRGETASKGFELLY